MASFDPSRSVRARHVRFKLSKPWPDFLTFYLSASGAGWIVPKKYVEKVGDAGFQKHPIGAGPYKFVSFTRRRSTHPLLGNIRERRPALC
jgi:ABC-type transport system substrate-binding protein